MYIRMLNMQRVGYDRQQARLVKCNTHVDIPASIFVDRYLEDNALLTKKRREQELILKNQAQLWKRRKLELEKPIV